MKVISLALLMGILACYSLNAQKPEAIISKASTVPIIDGVIDEVWNEAYMGNSVSVPFVNENPTLGNPGDTYWKALWTGEDNKPETLYLLVVVTDDDFYPAYVSGGSAYNYDTPEFYLDVNKILEDGIGPMTGGSGHYIRGTTIIEGKTNGEVISDPSGMSFAVMVNGSNYLVEYSILLSEFTNSEGYNPDYSSAIGFDLVINDNDRATENRDRASWSNSGEVDENYMNMDDAGLVYFEGLVGEVLIESLSLETGASISSDNGKLTLDYTVSPVVATEEDLLWSVSNGSGRARIDKSTGEITALVDGTVWVKLASRNAIDSCEVNISNQVVTRADLNLIHNGYFDDVNEDGTAMEWGGPSQVVDGVLFLDNPGQTDGNLWDCKISQEDMGCNNSDLYTLSFVLSASAPGPVHVLFEDPLNEYVNYGASEHELCYPYPPGRSHWEFTSTTEAVKYSFDVQFDQLLPTTKELFAFMLGWHSGDVTIDSVELINVADLDLLTPGPEPDYPERSRDGLVALYNLNGDFYDACGNLPVGDPNQLEWTDDRFCQSQRAVSLTGQNSYLEIANHDTLDLAGDFSLSFWLKLDSIPSEEAYVLYRGDPKDLSTAIYWVSVYPGSGNAPGSAWSFSYEDEISGLRTFTSDSGIVAGEWMCLSIASNEDSLIFYSGSERMVAFGDPIGSIVNTDEPLCLGNPLNLDYTGKMDQFAIYNRALSSGEIAEYFRQNAHLPGEENISIEVCPETTVELVCPAEGPFLNYTFTRFGEVIQQGPNSSCQIQIVSFLDLGDYSAIAENCFDTLKSNFTLEFACDPGALEILRQPHEIQLYQRSSSTGLYVWEKGGGWDFDTKFQWYQNGILTEYIDSDIQINNMSAADSGIYVCEIRNGISMIMSDPIHVIMLDPQSRPMADTLGLRAWYTFEGEHVDQTGNTGPGIAHDLVQDTGIYSEPAKSSLFNGRPAYLEIPADSDLDLEEPFTVMLMMRVDQAGSETEPILVKSSLDASDPNNYALYIDPEMHLVVSVTADDGTDYSQVSDWVMEKGRWYIMCVIYDGTRISCQLNDRPSQPLEIPQGGLKASDGPLIFGNMEANDIIYHLDDFRLYNRAMDPEEFDDYFRLHTPRLNENFPAEIGCVGDTISMFMNITGPWVNYEFSREGTLLQSGPSPDLSVPITSNADFGFYHGEAQNGMLTTTTELEISSGRLYDDLYLYDSNAPEIFASPGDQVMMSFYVNNNYEFLEYYLYHNDEAIPVVNRGILTIESVDYEDAGDYYFVVMNGCERLVSDTVHLYIEGGHFVEFDVVGWDWTGNISGSGNSYFSSIGLAQDGSFGLLGYYSGGLRVEGEEVFSSVTDDIFITKYDEQGNHQWSSFLKSPFPKGKADLAFDSEGNLYVCGSFREEIELFGDTLTDEGNSKGFLAKLNPMGELIWLKAIQSSRILECSHVKIDDQDKVYLAGNFTGSMSIGDQNVSGTWDMYSNVMFLASMDSNGDCQWIRHAVTADMEYFGLVDMELNAEGEPVVCGTYMNEADFGGGIVLSTPVEGPFLVKYDQQGTPQWGTTISTEFGFAEAFDVSVDDLDRVFMTGMHLGDVSFGEHEVTIEGDVMTEIFLARFDNMGKCTALSSYGSEGDGDDFGICYEPDSDTTGYLMGMYGDTFIMGSDSLEAIMNTGSALISSNMFIARLNDYGEALTMSSAGVKSNGFFGEIATTSDGRLIFAGLNSVESLQKGSQAQGQNIAFAGFKENGLLERTMVEKNEQLTICTGDSILFMGKWCGMAGSYEFIKAGPMGADTLIILELSTEVCTGMDKASTEDMIKIYPNPASRILNVESIDARVFDLALYELNGRLLIRKDGLAHYELAVGEYPSGLHILVLNTDGKITLRKIMVE